MSGLITDAYRRQSTALHAERPDYGISGQNWATMVETLIQAGDYVSVLDYGCGKETLAAALPHRKIIGYDPAVAGRGVVVPSDLVVCTDVLEHIEPECLNDVLDDIHRATKKMLFFTIALLPAVKKLDDGRNAHLILMPSDWWRIQLECRFKIIEWDDQGDELIGNAEPLLAINDDEIKQTTAVDNDERNAQVKVNVSRVRARVTHVGDAFRLPAHDHTAVLVCPGPSLTATWPMVKMAQVGGADVFTVSNAHRFATEHGIIPYAQIDCDPRPHKAVQMGTPHQAVRYWLASCIHPTYLDKLDGFNVALWHSFNGAESLIAMEFDRAAGNGLHRMIIGGGSVGLRAISLLYYLGYRRFEIHGMDCGSPYETAQMYAVEHLGKAKPLVRVKCGQRWFTTSPVFIIYARYFRKQMVWCSDASFSLHGDGMLQEMVKESNAATPLFGEPHND